MSEEPRTNDDPPEGDPPAGDPPPDTGGDDPAAEAAKWKAMARKHEAEAKKNADAAKRLAEIEEQGKSEAEKLAEQRQAAEARATSAERELARARVALRKGLTEAMAKRLQGDTEEELEADADELLAVLKIDDDDPADGLNRRPRERLRPGSRAAAEPEKDVKEVVAAIPRGQF